jgi:hypothetical protein
MKRILLLGIGIGCGLSLIATSFYTHDPGIGVVGGFLCVVLGLAVAAIFETTK